MCDALLFLPRSFLSCHFECNNINPRMQWAVRACSGAAFSSATDCISTNCK